MGEHSERWSRLPASARLRIYAPQRSRFHFLAEAWGHHVNTASRHVRSCEHSVENHFVTGGDCISASHAISEDGDELRVIGKKAGEGRRVSGVEGFYEPVD